ncbi:chromate transporter [Alkaliphilus peptidifermentans]|uniref:Chromate transporter n=1 Tax=Alkaliphilus peptidifermentans DSM 18978 TaxID=1120976 RepID=A0A1G5LAK9_9FIRM|nr:chromate transporter [Alkaliphilus peptidifermentans]SCZ09925.1 chromate transporter [Alkaliphilus peptidifermentans DSM 18978]
MKNLLRLFGIFFRVGAFTFGGGYAMVPIIQKEIVEKESLISETEFLDIIAVSQSLPGPIAVNTSIFVGYKLTGILGALSALLGTVLPSLVIIIILAMFYNQIKDINSIQLFFQGVRPAIVALIFMSALKLSKSIDKTAFNYSIMTIAFISIAVLNIHPILVVIACALTGLIFTARRKKENDIS